MELPDSCFGRQFVREVSEVASMVLRKYRVSSHPPPERPDSKLLPQQMLSRKYHFQGSKACYFYDEPKVVEAPFMGRTNPKDGVV
jgi:hypothetical protein